MERTVSLRKPVIFSLIIHIMTGLSLLLVPAVRKDITKPSIIRLITPYELEEVQPGILNKPKAAPSETRRDIRNKKESTVLSRKQQALPYTAAKVPRVPSANEKQSGISPDNVLRPDPGTPQTTKDKEAADSPGPSVKDNFSAQKGSDPQDLQRPAMPLRPEQGPSLREKLFDRDIIGKFANRETQKKENSITLDTGEFKYHTYMLRLKEKIEGIWIYPHEAASKGIYGDLKIRFTISKNGMLGSAEIIRTSGYRSLDEAALQALRDAEPFWPLPNDWSKDALTVDGHFIYSIYGTYIR